jgi:S1-C subfamily serine protease
LQQNDVVISVNGVRLVNAERITDVIGELRAATTVEIQIERDGTPQTLTLNMGGAR